MWYHNWTIVWYIPLPMELHSAFDSAFFSDTYCWYISDILLNVMKRILLCKIQQTLNPLVGYCWLSATAIVPVWWSRWSCQSINWSFLYYYFKIVRAMYFMKNDELVVQNCNPILFWSIIIFSLQNIIFYFYWPNLIESLNMILINTGIF